MSQEKKSSTNKRMSSLSVVNEDRPSNEINRGVNPQGVVQIAAINRVQVVTQTTETVMQELAQTEIPTQIPTEDQNAFELAEALQIFADNISELSEEQEANIQRVTQANNNPPPTEDTPPKVSNERYWTEIQRSNIQAARTRAMQGLPYKEPDIDARFSWFFQQPENRAHELAPKFKDGFEYYLAGREPEDEDLDWFPTNVVGEENVIEKRCGDTTWPLLAESGVSPNADRLGAVAVMLDHTIQVVDGPRDEEGKYEALNPVVNGGETTHPPVETEIKNGEPEGGVHPHTSGASQIDHDWRVTLTSKGRVEYLSRSDDRNEVLRDLMHWSPVREVSSLTSRTTPAFSSPRYAAI